MANIDTDLSRIPASSRVAESVEDKLRWLARDLGPGGRLPSVRVLMRNCGVSQLSVSARAVQARIGRDRSSASKKRNLRCRIAAKSCAPCVVRTQLFLLILPPSARFSSRRYATSMSGEKNGAVIRFTIPQLSHCDDVAPQDYLAPDLWEKLRARQFSSVLLFGTKPRLSPLLVDLDLPIVALATDQPRISCDLGWWMRVKSGWRNSSG